jgi:MarR family transcriptional regulator, 2-MHQ and catechol-resistance regulon repressor
VANFPIRVDPGFAREFPDADEYATEVCANLVHTSTMLMDVLNRHRASVTDLSPSASQVLAVLDGEGRPVPSNVIAERLLVTTASMTSLLDTLERRGFVARNPHPTDRRKILVSLTGAGAQVVDELLPVMRTGEMTAAGGLTAEQRSALVELLGVWQRHLKETASEPVVLRRQRRRRPKAAGARPR